MATLQSARQIGLQLGTWPELSIRTSGRANHES